MNRHHGFGGFNHPVLHLLVLLLIVAGIAALAVLLISHFRKGPSTTPVMPARPPAGADPALEHARLRYANGDLSRDDYLQLVSDLSGVPQPPSPPGRVEAPPPT